MELSEFIRKYCSMLCGVTVVYNRQLLYCENIGRGGSFQLVWESLVSFNYSHVYIQIEMKFVHRKMKNMNKEHLSMKGKCNYCM